MGSFLKTGQVPLYGLLITGTFTLLASVGAAWVSASSAADRKIAEVGTKVEVIQEREENHYKELSDSIKEMKGDIKTILKEIKNP